MEGIPYIKPWKTVLTKRGLATILYLIIALVTAGIVVLVGKICEETALKKREEYYILLMSSIFA